MTIFLLLPLVSAVPVELAVDGQAKQPIVVAEGASESVRAAAAALAENLGRMTGATFAVSGGDGARGIAVGRATDFPALGLAERFDPTALDRREEYLLRSHTAGLLVVGATDLAVEDAVWDLLHRLGYRQYFPGPTWEVVPRQATLRLALDEFQRPAYLARRIWYGFGTWDYNQEPYRTWCRRNRCVPGVELNTGHAYDGFVKELSAEFAAHPEYWPLLKGQRQPVANPKPCLGNPAVRALFVRQALARFERQPTLDSLSLDPSDGGGWCECPRCAALGSVSDQVVTLANEVAAAVAERFPGKLIGIYAYNYHSPPPSVRVHPNIVVSVATAFLKGGQTLDEIIAGWSERGATLGIREYYSVNTWDRDQPGQARGGNLAWLRRTIPEFHARGARFMSAEASDNWGPNGLGYWLAARLLWDPAEAERLDELVEDFLSRAFGPAAEPMREFYRQLDGSRPALVADDQLGRMFRALTAARELADTDAIRARLDELTLYARYVSLYQTYDRAAGTARQQAFEALVRHAYRMRGTMLVHTKALYRDLANRDKTVAIPTEAGWQIPEPRNPWKSSAPFTATELAEFRRDGVARHPLVELAFTPVSFSTDLVPATPLGLTAATPAGLFGPGRGRQTFYTVVEQAPVELELLLTGGLIAHYRDRGNIRLEVYQLGGASATGERETLVASDRSVPPDGVERPVVLRLDQPGLYRVEVDDGNDRTLVRWPADRPVTVVSTPAASMTASYLQWTGYFYVPRGTTVIGLYGGGHGEIRDSHDRPHLWLNGREPNYHAVSVPPGEDGQVWRIQYARGPVHLLTVPPCVAPTPGQLLLPREVVARDAR